MGVKIHDLQSEPGPRELSRAKVDFVLGLSCLILRMWLVSLALTHNRVKTWNPTNLAQYFLSSTSTPMKMSKSQSPWEN